MGYHVMSRNFGLVIIENTPAITNLSKPLLSCQYQSFIECFNIRLIYKLFAQKDQTIMRIGLLAFPQTK